MNNTSKKHILFKVISLMLTATLVLEGGAFAPNEKCFALAVPDFFNPANGAKGNEEAGLRRLLLNVVASSFDEGLGADQTKNLLNEIFGNTSVSDSFEFNLLKNAGGEFILPQKPGEGEEKRTVLVFSKTKSASSETSESIECGENKVVWVSERESSPGEVVFPSTAGFRNTVGTFIPLCQARSNEDFGIMDLGAMKKEVDLHKALNQNIMQILPLSISSANESPYSVASSRSIDPVYVSIEKLFQKFNVPQSLVTAFMFENAKKIDELRKQKTVDYGAVRMLKIQALKVAWKSITGADSGAYREFEAYAEKNSGWLEDHMLYTILKEKNMADEIKGGVHWTKIRAWDWRRWEKGLRDRDPESVKKAKEENKDEILFRSFAQFVAAGQYEDLADYGKKNGVEIMVDMPFALDGADIWMNPKIFGLKKGNGYRRSVTQGVPPEPAYPKGQYWQFYPYDWSNPKTMEFVLNLFKFYQSRGAYVRVDHVIGYYRQYLFTEDVDSKITLESLGIFDEITALQKDAYGKTDDVRRDYADRAYRLIKNKLFEMRGRVPKEFEGALAEDSIELAFDEQGELRQDNMIMIAREVPSEDEGKDLPAESLWRREYSVENAVHADKRKWDFLRIGYRKDENSGGNFMYDYLFSPEAKMVSKSDGIRLAYFKLASGEKVLSKFLEAAQESGQTVIFETLGIVPPAIQESVERLGGTNYSAVIYGEEPSYIFGKNKENNRNHPIHHIPNAFVTYGLHDSISMKKQWEETLSRGAKVEFLNTYLGKGNWEEVDTRVLTYEVRKMLLGIVYKSKARISVLTWIDLLGLGDEHRINTPGVQLAQWVNRLPEDCTVEHLLSAANGDEANSSPRALEAIKLIRELTREGHREKPNIQGDGKRILNVKPEVGGGVVQIRELGDKAFQVDAYSKPGSGDVTMVVTDEEGNDTSIEMEQVEINFENIQKWTVRFKARQSGVYKFRIEIKDTSETSETGYLIAVEKGADLNPLSDKYSLKEMLQTIKDQNAPKRSKYPVIYNVNTRVLKKRFSQISDEELKHIKALGADTIWFMGAWEESEYSRGCNEYYGEKKGIKQTASAYAINEYEISKKLGGEIEFIAFRERAEKFGIKLMLDIVPNHMSADSSLLQEHPEYFMRPDENNLYAIPGYTGEHSIVRTAENFSKTAIRVFRDPVGSKIFFYGRDPHSEKNIPWGDTVQFDYTKPEMRTFMKKMILKAAKLTNGGGLRIDQYNLTDREQIRRNWFSWDSNFDTRYPEKNDFWRDVISELKHEYPDIVLLAETYQNSGEHVHNVGIDFYYEEQVRDLLVKERNVEWLRGVLGHINSSGRFNFVKMLECHDIYDRIKRVLGREASMAAAAILYTIPGASLIYHEQEKGRESSTPTANFIDPNPEDDDKTIAKFYENLGKAISDDIFRNGSFDLLGAHLTSTGEWAHNVISFKREYKGKKAVVAVNYSSEARDVSVDVDGKILKINLPAWGHAILKEENGEFYDFLAPPVPSSAQPKAVILFADDMVTGFGFLDMKENLSLLDKGSIVLYGTKENCDFLEGIINSSGRNIGVFKIDQKVDVITEEDEIKKVVAEAKRLAGKSSGTNVEFMGVIKNGTASAVSLQKMCDEKGVGMPIVVFGNDLGIYSFKTALTEAFSRKRGGDKSKWFCYLEPMVKLSKESAEALELRIMERRAIATKA